MAIKVIQTFPSVTAASGSPGSSEPIVLKSGYLRVTTGTTGIHVAIGTSPTATANDFHLPPYGNEVIKERLARQKIVGIVTGTTTTIVFDNNGGNPFLVDDYVAVQDVTSPVGINTVHNPIVSMTNSSIVIDFDSTAFENIVVGAGNVSRSVIISALGSGGNSSAYLSEVVQLVTE